MGVIYAMVDAIAWLFWFSVLMGIVHAVKSFF